MGTLICTGPPPLRRKAMSASQTVRRHHHADSLSGVLSADGSVRVKVWQYGRSAPACGSVCPSSWFIHCGGRSADTTNSGKLRK